MKRSFLALILLLMVSCGPAMIEIKSPADNASVNGVVSVSGKCRNVNNVYIYAYSDGAAWTYQAKAAVTNNRFNGRAWLGESNEQGTEYQIIAVSGEFDPESYSSRSDLQSIPFDIASEPVRVIRN